MVDPLLCMNCGAPHLRYRQCKITCQNCGFMLDCSDLDVGNEIKQLQNTPIETPKNPPKK